MNGNLNAIFIANGAFNMIHQSMTFHRALFSVHFDMHRHKAITGAVVMNYHIMNTQYTLKRTQAMRQRLYQLLIRRFTKQGIVIIFQNSKSVLAN